MRGISLCREFKFYTFFSFVEMVSHGIPKHDSPVRLIERKFFLESWSLLSRCWFSLPISQSEIRWRDSCFCMRWYGNGWRSEIKPLVNHRPREAYRNEFSEIEKFTCGRDHVSGLLIRVLNNSRWNCNSRSIRLKIR